MEPLPPRRNAIAAAPGASTSVTFALDQQSQQQSRNSSNNLNASSTNDRSSTRDRTDYVSVSNSFTQDFYFCFSISFLIKSG